MGEEMMGIVSRGIVLCIGLFTFGCGGRSDPEASARLHHGKGAENLNKFFDSSFNERVKRYPSYQTYLGMKSDYNRLDTATNEYLQADQIIYSQQLEILSGFEKDGLNQQDRLSSRLLNLELEQEMASYKWRFHTYSLNQMFGFHTSTVSLMINMHLVKSKADAQDYIARLRDWSRYFREEIAQMKQGEQQGIKLPQLVFQKVIHDSKNMIAGAPFEKGKALSPLLRDFTKKIDELANLSPPDRKQLLSQAELALKKSVQPAYQELITYMQQRQKKSHDNHGVWALPNGKAYYKYLLKKITTTDLAPAAIHQTGLQEVNRIHGEMKQIMQQVNFKSNKLADFFAFMKKDKSFYLPSNKIGREKYLGMAKGLVAKMRKRLPEWFSQLPKNQLEVKPVEAYREKSAGLAFYSGPSLNGSRPGTFYLNLYNMKQLPTFSMEALIYHEALPGHHMQISLSQGLSHLPKFRRVGGFTVYSEGWGLYSERLPKEYGFYKDPYSNFGRLSMELWRACRLVVDTGLHAKRWTRARAIDYLRKNTSATDREISKSVDRYLVLPGQATSYMIGMLKILELRQKAKLAFGESFDIKLFHDQILKNGPLPLSILEEQVDRWIGQSVPVRRASSAEPEA